jgi:hypothetical protein
MLEERRTVGCTTRIIFGLFAMCSRPRKARCMPGACLFADTFLEWLERTACLGRHRTTASRQTSLREKPAQTLLHQLRTDGQSEGLLCGCFGGGVGGRLRGSGLMIPPTNKSVATRGYNPRLSPLTRLLQE